MIILHYSEPGSSGVKRHVVDLLDELSTYDGMELILAYSLVRSDKLYLLELQELKSRSVDICELPTTGELSPWRDLVSGLRFLILLHRKRPQIVHLHSSKSGGIGRLIGRLFFPSITILYAPHAMACFRSRLYLLVERVLAPTHDLLVAVSPSERDDFHRWAIECRPCRTWPLRMGLRLPKVVCPAVKDQAFTVVSCGRICHQKNALLFFQVALKLISEDRNYRFVWVGMFGNDVEAAMVRELLGNAGNPEEIVITGWLEEPLSVLATADLFCMFSRYESFGYVTAEAMLLEIPVLATVATGTRDLVSHGITGRVADASVEPLALAVEEMRRNPHLYREMAFRARLRVEKVHTRSGMAASVASLYHAINVSAAGGVV
jgi:glycosyltransferase involved in cell wall biosynthesis